MKNLILVVAAAFTLQACGGEDTDYGKTSAVGFGEAKLALTSSESDGVLRLGDSLLLQSKGIGDYLAANTRYRVTLSQADKELFSGNVLTDMQGQVHLQTLAHDIGEFDDGLKTGQNLAVSLFDGKNTIKGWIEIKDRLQLRGPGWGVEEVSMPHVFAADSKGNPTNAFVFGGKEEGEIPGPIYAAGDHFPPNQTVDIYVVKDADDWKNLTFPQPGDADYVAGPITVTTDSEGKLPATSTEFNPTAKEQLGPYDILVDVDRNGVFDWAVAAKDAADGLNKVGFTVQHSSAILLALGKHLIVNLAYDSSNRKKGTFANTYSGNTLYGYVNRPVFDKWNDLHKKAAWVVVEHQAWTEFWNNPDPNLDAECAGCRDLTPYMVSSGVDTVGSGSGDTEAGGGDTVVPVQKGCANAPPAALANTQAGFINKQGKQVKNLDIVLISDFNHWKKLIYRPGTDLLDVNFNNTNIQLVDPQTIDDTAKGFTVQ